MTRCWLGALALALLFCVVAAGLGWWQYSRHVDAATVVDRVTAHYDAAPVPLENVLAGPDARFDAAGEWTRVRATGEYRNDDELLVRNRPHRSVYGYEVVLPLELPGGGALLVDRGWVPNAETARMRPEVPPAPDGEVTVTGWLRSSEPSQGRDLPQDQLATVNLAEARAATGADLYAAYLVLGDEEVAGNPGSGDPARPEPLERPSLDRGPHFAYALQWWLTAPVGFVLVLVMARRERRETDAGAADVPADSTARNRPVRRRKPKKVRIWDEEDY